MKTQLKKVTKGSRQAREQALMAKVVHEENSKPVRRVGRLASPTKAKRVHVSPKPTAKAKAVARRRAATGLRTIGNGKENGAIGPAMYDHGFVYGEARYVTDPVPTPVPGKAKPNLGLSKQSDAALIGFGHSHDEAIFGNPRFPVPQPSVVEFDTALAAYEAKVSEIDVHREAGKALTNDRDLLRATFESIFTQRANYVELTSQGDASWILSTALPVKNGPTPMGILPAPLALRVDLTNDEGVMIIRWDPVVGAKSYMLEMAEVVNNVAGTFSLLYMGGKFSTRKTGMIVGRTYAFRVAAVGGEGGMSLFCPEVWRAAA